MTSKRPSRTKKPRKNNSSFNFQTLFSSLSSPQGLKSETLEGLYLLLLTLSCSDSECNLNFSETEFSSNEFKLKFKDTREISDKLLVEKGRIILGILRKCVSVELKGGNEKPYNSFEKEVSRKCMYVDNGGTTLHAEHLVTSLTSLSFAELSNPFHAIFCAVLEVVADELLMHESVRQYLLFVDSLSCGNEFVFTRHFGHGNVGSVLEVLSAHFILSLSDDQAFKNFIDRLFWLPNNNFRVPEMTLTTALSLFLNPVLLSAPKMFQAYLILLVSEVIGISMSSEHLNSSSELRAYLSAFESQMDFDSCLLPATKEKIHNLIAKFDNSWNSYLSSTLLKESCITLRGSSDDVDDCILHEKEDTSPQDICLLASILKLMSSAMLQAIRVLTQGGDSGSLKTSENVALSKEYDLLVATFNCFQQFGIRLPVQKFLHDMMEIQPTRHKKLKWMFFHFSGLLSLTGDLHAFGSLLDSRVKSSSWKSRVKVGKSEPSLNTSEVLVDRKSSHAVALKFQKIQTLYLGTRSQTSSKNRAQEQEPGSSEKNHVESALSIEETTGETCNGEIFLRCVLQGSQDSSAVADLADFIECKQGKDYSEWLKDREKFRRWKSEKLENLRWKKRRRAFQKKA
ncbi:Detected protein of unknown function [Hibiscus syriacus]|uniref:DUF7812 domain-containing protein n=1 Tax=Hibiscus syriacus TaxID=106335 RepID=A0A6A3BJU9_HIBSY|nr:Detected protein of unknown function [Hibiscus syriacus]